MPILNVKGHLPGTGTKSIIVVDTDKVSFISPCPGCDLVQVHCCGSYFETDRVGANSILHAMNAEAPYGDIGVMVGYEKLVEWE